MKKHKPNKAEGGVPGWWPHPRDSRQRAGAGEPRCTEGWPGPGARHSRALLPAHGESKTPHCLRHYSPHTVSLTHTHACTLIPHSHADPAGLTPGLGKKEKQGVWPLGAQPWPWPQRGGRVPHRQGHRSPSHRPLASSRQRGRKGVGELGQGWAPGPGGLLCVPSLRRREATLGG